MTGAAAKGRKHQMGRLRLTRREFLVSGSAIAVAAACGGTAAPAASGTAAATATTAATATAK
ncbi:MAG TPA: hypothetical protein VFQ66_08190, partial [Candidatus Limnocylindria bacterium]|nr:hypothetical protein [Candidatus Limnocylindria bacterium]